MNKECSKSSAFVPGSIKKKNKLSTRLKKELPYHILLLPATVLLIIFKILPMPGIIMAFQDFKPWLGMDHSPFVGFENFSLIFSGLQFRRVIFNTLFIAILKIVLNTAIPIIFALLLNEVTNIRFKRSVQTMVYLPHFLSWVVLGGIFIDLFSVDGGLFNNVICSIFHIQPISFFGDGNWFRILMITSDVWKEFGFSAIIYLSAITGIDQGLYEAAIVDGANRWKQTIHVTIPGIMPIIVVMGTLALGNVLNAGFDQIFNLYNPMVYDKADILDTYVYRLAFADGNYSLGTAIGLFKSAISGILILSSYKIADKCANYRIF